MSEDQLRLDEIRPPQTGEARILVELDQVEVDFAIGGGIRGKASKLRAVDAVSFAVREGETFGLVGETGSGKTTVAKVILRMERPTAGVVRIGGMDIQTLRGDRLAIHSRLVQMVMQDPYASLDPRMKVGDIIAEPLTGGNPLAARSQRVRRRVLDLIELVGLPSASARLYPLQFSGGQRQRIAIARALVADSKLIILDEPTSALDVSVRAQILNLLKDLQKKFGVTYLYISHDLATVAYMAATVAVMYLGR
ncbi:MAG: ATP-binding cassette domain-containing protein, partial [Candidatus Dormibacteraceae bacterium]